MVAEPVVFYSPQSAALDLSIEFLLRLRHGDHESETATEEETAAEIRSSRRDSVRSAGGDHVEGADQRQGDEARQAERFGPVIR